MSDDRERQWMVQSALTEVAQHQRELNAAMSKQADLLTLQQSIQRTCALMPSTRHCWHEQMELWSDLFPPALLCCWCGEETRDMTQAPHRHGPYAAMR